MPTWQPVEGSITRLDTTLASNQDIEDFLERERIIARRHAEGDTYFIELAVTGRRKHVAILGEDGEVVKGESLDDVIEKLDSDVRKLHIDIGGRVEWGDIDLGEVDVTSEDIEDCGDSGESSAADGEEHASSDSQVDSQGNGNSGVVEEEFPAFTEGAMLVLSDIPLSEIPSLAAHSETPIAAFKQSGANVLVSDVEIPVKKNLGFSDTFVFSLSVDPAGVENPQLAVLCDSARLAWQWTDNKIDCDWVERNEAAKAFAAEQLGAGAFVWRICEHVEGVDTEALTNALNCSSEHAPRVFVGALGLPDEVADCLDGLLEARNLPRAKVFEPTTFSQRFRSQVAYEVAGEGVAKPELWELFRKIYLDSTVTRLAIGAAEIAIGTRIFTWGIRSMRTQRPHPMIAGLGAAMVGSSIAGLSIAYWLSSALDSEGLSGNRGAEQ